MRADTGSFRPRSISELYGLGTLGDGESSVDPESLRALYRHARDEDGRRKLIENNATFARGWVDLNTPEAARLISVFIPMDDPTDAKHAKRLTASNLEAQAWNDLLGIESPPIKCVVKIHGNQWGLRFVSATPCLKGQELVNEQLPPIPSGASATRPGPRKPDAARQPTSAATPTTPPVAPPSAAAAEVLRKAGLPT